MTTFDEGDGAIVGPHRVIVQGSSNELEVDARGSPSNRISTLYRNAGKPLLKAVVDNGDTTIDFDLKPRP